jgi:hypothetical protein
MEIQERKVEIDLGFCLIHVLYRVLPCGYKIWWVLIELEENIVQWKRWLLALRANKEVHKCFWCAYENIRQLEGKYKEEKIEEVVNE